MSAGFKVKKNTATKEMLDALDWSPIKEVVAGDKSLPYVTHQATWNIAGVLSVRVVQLSTGERVVPEEELAKIFAFGKEN